MIVASKDRSAFTASQLAGAIALGLLGAHVDVDKTQKIRVSLVTKPTVDQSGNYRADSHATADHDPTHGLEYRRTG